MPHAKKSTAVVSADSSSGVVVTQLTASEAKKAKLDRLHAKNRQFVLAPKDHRERVIEPLVKQVSKLLLLALALGNSANAGDGAAEKTDKMVETIRKRFNDFKEDHIKKLRRVGTYYSTLHRVAGKRAERAASGELAKPRQSGMHRAISTFQPSMYNFIREAAASNDALRSAGSCSTFDAESPLKGYMSPTYAAQFILAYVASNRRFNKTNGQYIQPDDLMKKHLGAGIDKVLASINASIAAEKDPKKKERLQSFPGQFTFCKLQELIGFYRVKPAEGSQAAADVTALRKDEENWQTLRAEFDVMSQVRENAYARLHAENPRQVKTSGPKGPRGPLTEQQKHARKIKREAKAAAGALGFDLEFKPKTVKPEDEAVATA